MKKIILLILILLLIPFFIITIKDIDREEVNPTLTYNLTTTDSTYTNLNGHTLQELFESITPVLQNLVTNGSFSDTLSGWGAYNVGEDYRIVSSRLRWTKPITSGSNVTNAFKVLTLVVDDIYYVIGQMQTTVASGTIRIRVLGTGTQLSSEINANTSLQNISCSFTADKISTYLIFEWLNTTDIESYQYLDNVQVFNLTSLYGVTATTGTAYDNAVAEIEWILSKNDGYIQSVGNPFEIVDLTIEEMDDWYTIYQTYHTTYTTLTLGTATPTTYTSLQQLILDNDDKDFKLYRDDIIDETHYRLTQETDYISIINDDDLEIIRINDDDTFESSLQIDDTVDYKIVGYNITGYIDGSFDNTILAFVWIIPILLIGGFFFVIFSHRKED